MTDKGVVVFAAAGGGSGDRFYPAAYADTNPMVQAVAAENADGAHLDGIDPWGSIAAPTNVRVVFRQSQPDSCAGFGGVSSATGQPAAAYALIRSLFPALTPLQALRRLQLSTLPIDGVTFGRLNTYLATTRRVFLVGSRTDFSRSTARDALNFSLEPFAVRTRYFTTSFATNEPTRIMLLVYNLDPATPLANVSVRTTDLNDANGKSLTIESIAAVTDMPFLSGVVVLLRDDLSGAGDVRVRLTVNGTETDPVLVKIR